MKQPTRRYGVGPVIVALALGVSAGAAERQPAREASLKTSFRFEVRLAEDRPAPTLHEAPLRGSNRTLYVHPDAIVTNDDVARTAIIEGRTASRWAVAVELTPLGGHKMRKATSGHIGKPVAVIVDGVVVMAPTISASVSTAALISGEFTRADAEWIADAIGPHYGRRLQQIFE